MIYRVQVVKTSRKGFKEVLVDKVIECDQNISVVKSHFSNKYEGLETSVEQVNSEIIDIKCNSLTKKVYGFSTIYTLEMKKQLKNFVSEETYNKYLNCETKLLSIKEEIKKEANSKLKEYVGVKNVKDISITEHGMLIVNLEIESSIFLSDKEEE